MQVKRILELFWNYWDRQRDIPGATLIAIEDFWFDWDMQEKTEQEIRDELIDAGHDPDAFNRKIQLMLKEIKANNDMQEALSKL